MEHDPEQLSPGTFTRRPSSEEPQPQPQPPLPVAVRRIWRIINATASSTTNPTTNPCMIPPDARALSPIPASVPYRPEGGGGTRGGGDDVMRSGIISTPKIRAGPFFYRQAPLIKYSFSQYRRPFYRLGPQHLSRKNENKFHFKYRFFAEFFSRSP